MEKVVKSSVSVPENLYVTRKADAQLATVITEMSRPGYISVARQMGKTSLLQHAKNRLQSPTRTIVYFDLSAAVYGSAQQYFQHLIDTILEVEEESLAPVQQQIAQRRQQIPAGASASGEFDKELRLILRALPGALVLILDEVDALAKAAYSDEVFAQIRSVYFMRNTHAVLHKLTYVLSGVIEPAKLIKNKDNSPFNIATRIFLDDFSLEEYTDFILKTQLNISPEVAASIYDWTSGNPRMTYEVCSAIEDRLLLGEAVSTATVDAIVHDLYLVQYNKPPVDHIREVVLKSSLVRNAVRTVRKGGELSDESASLLYLYGIIASQFKSATPTIKNRVLNAALSDAWLREVELQQKDLYTYGVEQLGAGELVEGIATIIEYLESANPEGSNRNKAFFSIANAYHKLDDFVKSNEYLARYSVSREDQLEDYYYQQLLRGINLVFLNQITDGLQTLQAIIDDGIKNRAYFSAIINQANFKLNDDFDTNHNEISTLLRQAIEDVKLTGLPDDYKNHIVSTANFRLGTLNLQLNEFQNSQSYFKNSLDFAASEMQPSVLVGLLLVDNEVRRPAHAERLKTIIMGKTLSILPKLGSDSEFTQQTLRQSLSILYDFYPTEYPSLIQECAAYYYQGSKAAPDLVYEVGSEKLRSLSGAAEGLFSLALTYPNLSQVFKARCQQGLAMSFDVDTSEFRSRALTALDAILATPDYEQLNYQDLNFIVRGALSYREVDNYLAALRFISYLTTRLDEEDEAHLPGDCIIIYYLAFDVYSSLKNMAKGSEFMKRALDLVQVWRKGNGKTKAIMDGKTVEAVIANLREIEITKRMQGAAVLAKVSRYDKLPRNTTITVQYKSGRTATGKAKKFEADLEAGKCFIL